MSTLETSAHPRSRGENLAPVLPMIGNLGSSPLTRGKQSAGDARHEDRRLIPAHAGKTVSEMDTTASLAAHPRSRGENDHVHCPADHVVGSSPLTRGKLPRQLVQIITEGLIPAHAGKTRCASGRQTSSPAHPRSRGENTTIAPAAGATSGSSPLTRGKPQRAQKARVCERLIPAHAGKT